MTIGFAWWLCTGEASPALPLALFFELFWLDLYPIGSFIPPMASFPYLLLMGLSAALGWGTPASLAFPLAVTLPLAYVIPYLEAWQRDTQKRASDLLLNEVENQESLGNLPQKLVLRSLCQQLCLGLGLFLGLYLVIAISFAFLTKFDASFPLTVNWPFLYAIAAVGALAALRGKRAYFVFAFSMGAVLVLKLF